MSGKQKLTQSKLQDCLSFAVCNSSNRDLEDARKFSAPERKVLKADVKKGLDSLISASMARNIRDTKRPSLVKTFSQLSPLFDKAGSRQKSVVPTTTTHNWKSVPIHDIFISVTSHDCISIIVSDIMTQVNDNRPCEVLLNCFQGLCVFFTASSWR